VTPQAEIDRRQIVEAQALLKGLTEFSQRAGHDLLGPLNQASSLLALFIKRQKSQAGGADGGELLEFLQTASARMEGIVTGVRKYMEIAGRRPRLESVDLNVALAAGLESLRNEISASGAVVTAEPLPIVTTDARSMATMFEILIGNAIKFSKPETAPRIRISSRPEGRFEKKLAAVVVEDEGIGIEPENREVVFQPFKRLNGREYPGQGLGLAIASLIAGMHGGSLRLDAGISGGTRVELTVPAAE
jgi:signal transduction histidine kinase